MDVRIECPTARGSGTAVARLDGGGTLVVSNHHVVRNQTNIALHAGDGKTTTGKLVAVDAANDLAAVAIDATWPVVNLGDEVTIGTPVQFRAFDAGLRFRKYFGTVRSEYQQAGSTGGFFATGASVPGNSGGGVYSRGRLVGVVWGNPNGGTAFVRIGPVRRLIERACGARRVERNTIPEVQPSSSDEGYSPDFPVPIPRPCDCDERWRQLELRLESLNEHRPSPSSNLDWLKIVAPAIGISGPIGVAIVVAGVLLRGRRMLNQRGTGGPRDDGFLVREEAS